MAFACSCNENMDIRNCCEPNCQKIYSIKQFNNCKQNIHTLYVHIFNDYDIYKYLEKRNHILNKCAYKV